MMTNGTLASVASGAIAIALGVKITPASRFTLSRHDQLLRELLRLSGFGPVFVAVQENSMLTPDAAASRSP